MKNTKNMQLVLLIGGTTQLQQVECEILNRKTSQGARDMRNGRVSGTALAKEGWGGEVTSPPPSRLS